MKDRSEVLYSIIEKASEDTEFRNAMLTDARSAISKEFDIDVPDDINIVVHENSSGTVHLPLPASPEVLSESELKQVGGGCGGCCY